ncbi:acidic mammalian chitinase-like [Heterodontus francisci]|uniref:acidic mammalian chitinase-like n=1 Tax=Heterodontus francisci TaxID=7792 RepID=UPI00355B7EB4
MGLIFGLIVGFILLFQLHPSSTYVLVCYFTNWAQYRPGIGRYMPNQIDPFMCSHLIYAFASMNDKHELTTFEWNDEVLYQSFNGLKKRNPDLKTLLALGGWKFGSKHYNKMVSTETNRAKFINSVISFLTEYEFDGFDLDWEYPGSDGNPPESKQLFSYLVEEMESAFTKEAKKTGKARLLLTAAVAAGKENIDASYDIPKISQHLDFISVMTYDFHGAWDAFTGHNSPLYRSNVDRGVFLDFNIDFVVKYWEKKGAPANKLLVGIATYGRSFTLSSSNSSVGAPASGPGPEGKYTKEAGILANYEICDFLKGAEKRWIVEQEVPYAVKGDIWLGYDNLRSIDIKKSSYCAAEESIFKHLGNYLFLVPQDPKKTMSKHQISKRLIDGRINWLLEKKFGGVLVWTLDFDDFIDHCKQGIHPVLKRLNKKLLVDMADMVDSGLQLSTSVVKVFVAVVTVILTT